MRPRSALPGLPRSRGKALHSQGRRAVTGCLRITYPQNGRDRGPDGPGLPGVGHAVKTTRSDVGPAPCAAAGRVGVAERNTEHLIRNGAMYTFSLGSSANCTRDNGRVTSPQSPRAQKRLGSFTRLPFSAPFCRLGVGAQRQSCERV